MMILIPFIAFSLAAALFYKVAHYKKNNQSNTKNKLFNIMHKPGYATTKTTAVNAINYRNIRPAADQALRYGPATNKTVNSCIDIDEIKATGHNELKKPLRQITGNTLDQKAANTNCSTVSFNDSELGHIRAGYIHRSTGKRKLSSKNRDSYIAGKDGKVFDARKIIKVMQKKFANENGNKSHENSMALKLHLLQAGIHALMAQDELPESFTLPDHCIVHRTVKNVTYGELKKFAKTRKPAVLAENPSNWAEIIAKPPRQPRIKALKINYKIRNSKPFTH
jgi:hypothetical protein